MDSGDLKTIPLRIRRRAPVDLEPQQAPQEKTGDELEEDPAALRTQPLRPRTQNRTERSDP